VQRSQPIDLSKVINEFRNVTLYKLARALKGKKVPDCVVVSAVRTANTECCAPPLEDWEVKQILHNALTQPESASDHSASSWRSPPMPVDTELSRVAMPANILERIASASVMIGCGSRWRALDGSGVQKSRRPSALGWTGCWWIARVVNLTQKAARRRFIDGLKTDKNFILADSPHSSPSRTSSAERLPPAGADGVGTPTSGFGQSDALADVELTEEVRTLATDPHLIDQVIDKIRQWGGLATRKPPLLGYIRVDESAAHRSSTPNESRLRLAARHW
jgi:hypothetical protein